MYQWNIENKAAKWEWEWQQQNAKSNTVIPKMKIHEMGFLRAPERVMDVCCMYTYMYKYMCIIGTYLFFGTTSIMLKSSSKMILCIK